MMGGPGGGPGMMMGGPGGGPGMMGGPGGGPGMWGGPGGGGGMWGGGGGGFVSRLDANGNGMLDPEESQGRARMFLDRTGLDLSRPIPMDQVTRAFDDMRNRMSEEMGGRWPGGGRGEEGDQGSGKIEVQPLVPGFGEPDLFEPVLGFGDMGEKLAVKIDEQDLQSAQSTMGQMDSNRDGMLDADEIRNSRWRGNDPLQTDRNRDGKLSLNELALRFAVLRSEREGGNADNRGGDPNRGGRGGGGAGGNEAREGQDRMVQMIFGRYDRNGNGVLEKDEWSSFRSDPSGYDTNHDNKITREEFAASMANRFGGRGGEAGGGGGWYSRREGGEEIAAGSGGDGENARGTAAASGRKSYRLRTSVDRLAELKDLPSWFGSLDADANGQVEMAEFSSSWSDSVVADFSQFDLNNDGIVTPSECLKATEEGAVRGSASSSSSSDGESRRGRDRGRESRREPSRSESPGTDEDDADDDQGGATSPPMSTPAAAAAAAANNGAEAKPAEAEASSAEQSAPAATGDVPAKVVKYAVGFIKRYDTNNDGVLTQDEWTKLGTDYSSADFDKDGRITPLELGAQFNKR